MALVALVVVGYLLILDEDSESDWPESHFRTENPVYRLESIVRSPRLTIGKRLINRGGGEHILFSDLWTMRLNA